MSCYLPLSVWLLPPRRVLVSNDECAGDGSRAQLAVSLFCNVPPAQTEDQCRTRRHLCVKYGIDIVVRLLEIHRPWVCTGNTLWSERRLAHLADWSVQPQTGAGVRTARYCNISEVWLINAASWVWITDPTAALSYTCWFTVQKARPYNWPLNQAAPLQPFVLWWWTWP